MNKNSEYCNGLKIKLSMDKKAFQSVNEYIESFPSDIQERLVAVRNAIKLTSPSAIESISYGMPAYKYKGKPLVYFAAFTKHIGFYATPNGHAAFAKELSSYKQGRGSVQFPLNKQLPIELIIRMVEFKVKEYNTK